MNRTVTFILSLFISFSALAFDLTGKTFKGTSTLADGTKATMTMVFRGDNKVSSTLSQTGKRTKTATLLWEVAGDYINIYEPEYCDLMVLGVKNDYDDEGNYNGIALIVYDALGGESMILRQVKSTSAQKSPAKKSTGKKRR